MSDGDAVVADENFSDDELNDALAFLDGQVLGVLCEACEEPFEVLGELKVGLGVVQFGVERGELGGDRGLAFAQRRHAGAELVECDELFLVGLDQAGAAGLHRGRVRAPGRRGGERRGFRSAARSGAARSRL